MRKSEIYSWRLSPDTKAVLEDEAPRQRMSLASVLDQIVQEWRSRQDRPDDDVAEQVRLYEAVAKSFGRLAGSHPYSAARTREVIRERSRRPRPGRGLIDTGPILALLDRNDPWHRPCVEAMWTLVRSGAVTVASIADDDLDSPHALMVDCRDRPMDFADATLVRLAHRESLTEIFTIDHDDFEAYRIDGRRRFRIVPDRARRS